MPMTPEIDALHEVWATPETLAEQLGVSVRLIRKKARETGACRLLGRTMRFTPEDIDALVRAFGFYRMRESAMYQKQLAEEREKRQRLGLDPRPSDRGYIYYVAAEDRVKIGFAKNVKNRMHTLKTSSPVPLVLLATHRGSQKKERELHRQFAEYRIIGEWFRFDGALKEHVMGLTNK